MPLPSDRERLPIALFHGLFGWGEITPLWGAAPFYFPLNEIRRARPGTVVAVEMGANTSTHDRACEAFAQLYGVCTDYGEAHAARCGHTRLGRDHSTRPLIQHWDAAHPIHIVGHSLGGNTALMLVTLLAQDFWGLGTSAAWVRSVSTICSPLRGCTLPFTWGLRLELQSSRCSDVPCRADAATSCEDGACSADADATSGATSAEPDSERQLWLAPRLGSVVHILTVLCSPLLKAQLQWPWLRGLYDFGVDQWVEHATWRAMFSMQVRRATGWPSKWF